MNNMSLTSNRNYIETESEENISRRRFIGNIADTAAMVMAGVNSSALTVQIEGKRKNRIGITGCGSVSWKYIPEIQLKPYLRL